LKGEAALRLRGFRFDHSFVVRESAVISVVSFVSIRVVRERQNQAAYSCKFVVSDRSKNVEKK